MVKTIFITNDNKKDSISIYEKEPVYVVHFERKDFNSLKQIDEANKAGIYVLVGDKQRYVGQASNKILNRLANHITNQEFWTSALFFGRNDGLIDKSQLDYLEKYYIGQFEAAGFTMTNSTVGNTSKIHKLNKIKADEIKNIFEEIIDDVANIQLFSLSDELLNEEQQSEELYVRFQGKKISHHSPRHVEINFVKAILDDRLLRQNLLAHKIDGKASYKNKLGTEQNLMPSGAIGAKEIEPGIFLWVNQSKQQTSIAIKKIADLVGLAIDLNF